jgi:hypothetical protein
MGVHGGDFVFMYYTSLTGGTKERHDKHQTDLSQFGFEMMNS